MISKRKKGILFAICIGGLIIIGALFDNFQGNTIRERGKLEKCFVSEVYLSKRPTTPSIKCSYVVNGDTFVAGYNSSDLTPIRKLKMLEGKVLIVLYDTVNPQYNRVLLRRSDFEKYNIQYPDSLSWIEATLN